MIVGFCRLSERELTAIHRCHSLYHICGLRFRQYIRCSFENMRLELRYHIQHYQTKRKIHCDNIVVFILKHTCTGNVYLI